MNATFQSTGHITRIRRGSKSSYPTRSQCTGLSLAEQQISPAGLVEKISLITGIPVLLRLPSDKQVLDFRTAATADNREDKLIELLDQLYTRLYAGEVVEITWPRDVDASAATVYLGAPLASVIHRCVEHTDGKLIIHTRTGTPGDFETLPFSSRVTFIVHLSGEEAAMRWERGEADPGRRLAAASRLRSAGWKVHVCLGLTQVFPGWREDYTDLAQRCISAEFLTPLVSVDADSFFNSRRRSHELRRTKVTQLSSRHCRELCSCVERVVYDQQLQTAA